MSSPFVPFLEANSCSICPKGQFASSVENDDTSCQICQEGKSNTAGSTSCGDRLPDGNGNEFASGRVGSLGGIIDNLLQDYKSGTPSSTYYMSTSEVEATYGKIQDWDVSHITNMKKIFYAKLRFNADLSRWDTSSVETMYYSK